MFLVWSFHSLEAVRPTIAKAKVLTSEAEKEEGGFSWPEFRAHFLLGRQGRSWVLPPRGPFLAKLWPLILDRGAFLPAGCTPFQSGPSRPHPAQHTLALPEPPCNCLGSLQTPDCRFQVGGECPTDLLWEEAWPSPTPRATTGTK